MRKCPLQTRIVRPPPPVGGGCFPPPSGTRIARLLCDFIRSPMSVGGAGSARPEMPRKFAVGLFCGGAFHDVAFTRMDGCDVVGLCQRCREAVRLCDWELRMRTVARSFFPEQAR